MSLEQPKKTPPPMTHLSESKRGLFITVEANIGVPSRAAIADRVERLVWPVPVVVRRDSAVSLRVPDGSWVYIDPPYRGVKGYLNALERGEVVRLAARCLGVASSVAVSEAERLSGLVDWRVVTLTNRRRGQSRKDTRSHEELITISRRPVGVRW